jgi:hypothetical protein
MTLHRILAWQTSPLAVLIHLRASSLEIIGPTP